MTDDKGIDLGFIITKPPLESGAVKGVLNVAIDAQKEGRRVGLFLISDGVWLAKSGQANEPSGLFSELLTGGARATVSGDHILAAGISEEDLADGVEVTRKPYKALVENVMENWDRVMVI
jgi:sulfur relay (sulfurtransferase) complex TusBCD TusD component (DsrE family)